jgi:hypothetical protein
LDWLRELYGSVFLPEAVWREVTVAGAGLPEAVAVQAAVADGWMVIREAPALDLDLDAEELDSGEAAAIALARALGAILIMDDAAGRRVGQRFGLHLTGTAGVLLTAKLRGLTPSLARQLDRLQAETTFWLKDELRTELLRQASEST